MGKEIAEVEHGESTRRTEGVCFTKITCVEETHRGRKKGASVMAYSGVMRRRLKFMLFDRKYPI